MSSESPHIERIIESTINSFDYDTRTTTEFRSALRTRFVWYVGLSGYALLNAKIFWEAIRGAPITGLNLVWLASPWIIAVIVAVVAQYFTDKWAARDDSYRFLKRGLLDMLRIKAQIGAASVDEYNSILKDEEPSLQQTAKHVNALERWVSRLERLTFVFLMLGFVWAAIGPLLLR